MKYINSFTINNKNIKSATIPLGVVGGVGQLIDIQDVVHRFSGIRDIYDKSGMTYLELLRWYSLYPDNFDNDIQQTLELYDSYNGFALENMSNALKGLELKYFPNLNYSNCNNISMMLWDSTIRYIGKINAPITQRCDGIFWSTKNLREIGLINIPGAIRIDGMFYFNRSLKKIRRMNIGSNVTQTGGFMLGAENIEFLEIHGLGLSPQMTSIPLTSPRYGFGSEINRQSLIDTLITYSYDRLAAGYNPCTVQLSQNTYDLLSDDELSIIANKGYTIAV